MIDPHTGSPTSPDEGPIFNLACEPWIPVVFRSDRPDELMSLRDTLVRAHELLEIRDESPLVTIALYRMILAVLHSALGTNGEPWPQRPEDVRAVWDQGVETGGFPADRIDDYLKRMSDARRLDLFGPRAFYQTPTAAFTKPPEPIERIVIADRASDKRPAVFDKRVITSLSPAEAARHLVAFHAFALGGSPHITEKTRVGEKLRSGAQSPMAFGALFLVRLNSLFATLVGNAVYMTLEGFTGHDQIPAWERPDDDYVRFDDDYVPHDRIDFLTHQSRVVRLTTEVAEDGPRITGVNIKPGRTIKAKIKLKADGTEVNSRGIAIAEHEVDMMLGQGPGKPPFSIASDRALWSSAHALYAVSGEHPLGCIEHVHDIELDLDDFIRSDGLVSLEAFGLTLKGGGGAVDGWYHETLPIVLPGSERREGARVAVNAAIVEAERIFGILNTHAGLFARQAATRGRSDTRARAIVEDIVYKSGPGRDYWAALAIAFSAHVEQLARTEPDARSVVSAQWNKLAASTALDAFDGFLDRLSADGRHWLNSNDRMTSTRLARVAARDALDVALKG